MICRPQHGAIAAGDGEGTFAASSISFKNSRTGLDHTLPVVSGSMRANIRAGDHHVHIGYFVDERDAARAYDRAAEEHFGKFALTNHQLGLLPTGQR